MAIEIRHNRAPHTHENTQFRRVALSLQALFDAQNWEGLLIGNPESGEFSRFRADAILLFNHGLIIIDLKDYQGSILLPALDEEFINRKWYNETVEDRRRIEIKGGSRFINPFRQLKSYREAMYDIINSNPILRAHLNPSRVAAVNLFSGPIELNRKPPRSLPYYAIQQEADFGEFLYDYASENSYTASVGEVLKRIFPAAPWEEKTSAPLFEKVEDTTSNNNEEKLVKEIQDFLMLESSGVLVLESLDSEQRDAWVQQLLAEGTTTFEIPQVEVLTHSSRIRHKIFKRSGIQAHGIYGTIYGGSKELSADEKESVQRNNDSTEEKEEEDDEENLKEVIPIKTDGEYDEGALVIVHEAHLVSRSLFKTELLKFGSGRLLVDLIKFLNLETTRRKLVLVGDPYSLSYGKTEDSAIHLPALKELYNGEIFHFRKPPLSRLLPNAIDSQRIELGHSIDIARYNYLRYPWDQDNLCESNKEEVLGLLRSWFSVPLASEPRNAMFVYSNSDALKVNRWIKVNCLKNTENLAPGDLLLLNNNIIIPDDSGLGHPVKQANGMYLKVNELKETHAEDFLVQIKGEKVPVCLSFIKLKVACLSTVIPNEAELWILDNYFQNVGLSKAEIIAFKIFVNKRVKLFSEKQPFEKSEAFQELELDNEYRHLQQEADRLRQQLEKGEKVKGKLEKIEVEIRKIERKYKRRHHLTIVMQARAEDPLINAGFVSYGWVTTVHKAVGSKFDTICLNSKQGELNGVSNETYYRWLYSALSTAEERAYVLNAIEVDPLGDCQFEDVVEEGWNVTARRNAILTFNNYTIPESYEMKFAPSMKYNIKGAIALLCEFFKEFDIELERTEVAGEYLTKAKFFNTNETGQNMTIVFNNNGQGQVSSIRAERNNGIPADIIEAGITEVKRQADSGSSGQVVEWPSDFRKNIYDNWINICETKGATLILKASHSYQDVFLLNHEESKAEFQLIYDGKGFFTKIKIVKKTDSEISVKLHNWLLHGN